MRILVVKLGSIGDIVHALPAAAMVRRWSPDADISWVVERRAAEILRDNPLLDRLIEVDTKALRRWPVSGETLLAPREQLRRLRASAFDLAIDFQGLLKSASIALLSGAPRRYGFDRANLREPASRFLLTDRVPIPTGTHVICKNLLLATRALGIVAPTDVDDWEFPVAVTRAHVEEAEAVAAPFASTGYAVLNPGGGWPTKMWSVERFGLLADQMWIHHRLHSIVTHGPGEQPLAHAVVEHSRSGRAHAASLSLKGFYALAQRAAVYVGGDTGPTHLAVAAGAPVVGLFGPTEWWRNGSPRSADICVERTDISCRTACHRRACSDWVCMDIEVERVLAAVSERLRRVREAREMKGAATIGA